MAAVAADEVGRRGATLPFTEYEAENAVTNGDIIGPDRRFTAIAAEASGRKAVRLATRGEFVEFVLARPANALAVRAAIPDTPAGTGLDAGLGIYVRGRRIGTIPLTSRYGWFYGRYPFTNRPADGNAHHFFDEGRLLLGRVLPAGTVVRLMVGKGDNAPWYVLDLADFELVPPPRQMPPVALSVVAFGADRRGRAESLNAFRRAIAAARARHRPVWVPPGTYRVDGHIEVDDVTVAGAGPWYSVLHGDGIGFYGGTAPKESRHVVLRDFAIIGEVKERDDKSQLAGIGGAMGGGSEISNLWIQHVKAGLWFDGPMDGLAVRHLRILDLTADGLNFHRGVSHALVEQTFVRNSGDDALAAWSGGVADHDIVFRRNTIVAPILANGIAIYGGRDIVVSENVIADSVTEGGGIHLGNRFNAIPLSGRIDIVGNLVLRSGSLDPNWKFGVGALWFYALDDPIAASIRVSSTEIVDSSEQAVQFIGKSISGVRLEGVRIDGTGTHAMELRSPGSATLSGISATRLGGPFVTDYGLGFRLVREDGTVVQ